MTKKKEEKEERKEAWIVILENDGFSPDDGYYTRRHRMGLRVRKEVDTKISAVARRLSDTGGVIVQEGCVVTGSYSQARVLAAMARSYGVPYVHIGRVDIAPYLENEADLAALDKINEIFGKRGRPPQPVQWTVSCLEELRAYNEWDSTIPLCPGCGGTNIKSRPGAPKCFADDPAESVFEMWLRTRFPTGGFEIHMTPDDLATWEPRHEAMVAPIIEDAPPLTSIQIKNDGEKAIVQQIQQSPIYQMVNDPDAPFPRETMLIMLDAIFVSRGYTPKVARDNLRQAANIHYVKIGGASLWMALAEQEPDLFDLAAVYGPQEAAAFHKTWVDWGNA